jgi:hypothetical protein
MPSTIRKSLPHRFAFLPRHENVIEERGGSDSGFLLAVRADQVIFSVSHSAPNQRTARAKSYCFRRLFAYVAEEPRLGFERNSRLSTTIVGASASLAEITGRTKSTIAPLNFFNIDERRMSRFLERLPY